jgi:RimJ/RimL family protein N-acetyltransferase
MREPNGMARESVDLRLDRCTIRSWRESDAESLAAHANNRNVWINLRDRFPHPYAVADAHAFIRASLTARPETAFAIAVEGCAVGGIGYIPHENEERLSAEIGYWLGEPYWGRGIATEALVAITRRALEAHGLTRLFAITFAWNAASCRVLDKAGYVLEGRMRKSAIKDGQIVDQLLYAYVAE